MKSRKSKPIYNLILSAMFSAVTVLCAWITVPMAVPFTMQTLAIFIIALLLDVKYGLLSICIYIGLGAVGLPVFSGFQGGIGTLLGPTGGYIIGFILVILIAGIFKTLWGMNLPIKIVSLTVGLVLCYLLGTLWFMFVSKTGFWCALTICVFPYVIFDIIKLVLGVILSKRLEKII